MEFPADLPVFHLTEHLFREIEDSLLCLHFATASYVLKLTNYTEVNF